MILRDAETRFTLTFTSGGAANAEMWIRDWVETWGLRVHVMDRTMSLAAINVTGPFAKELLGRLGLDRAAAVPRPRPRRHRRRALPRDAAVVHGRGGVRAAPPGRRLRRAVAGADGRRARPRDPAARPPGAVRAAAREGPRDRRHGHGARHDARAGSGWTGRSGWRSRRSSAGRRWSEPRSSTTSGAGSGSRWTGRRRPKGRRSGRSTAARSSATSPGSWTSPLLGKALMLGWQRRAPFADRVEIDGREAVVTPTPFYDPEGVRARA